MGFSTFYCGWQSYWYWCNPNLMYNWSHSPREERHRKTTWFLTCLMLCDMIGAPHPLHTHSSTTSFSYTYNVSQALLLWPVVISYHNSIPSLIYFDLTVDSISGSRRFTWVLTWIIFYDIVGASHTLHTHISIGLLHTYIWVSAPFTVAKGHKGATPTWYVLVLCLPDIS